MDSYTSSSLQEFSQRKADLENQIADMESQIGKLKHEISALKVERHQQRNLAGAKQTDWNHVSWVVFNQQQKFETWRETQIEQSPSFEIVKIEPASSSSFYLVVYYYK